MRALLKGSILLALVLVFTGCGERTIMIKKDTSLEPTSGIEKEVSAEESQEFDTDSEYGEVASQDVAEEDQAIITDEGEYTVEEIGEEPSYEAPQDVFTFEEEQVEEIDKESVVEVEVEVEEEPRYALLPEETDEDKGTPEQRVVQLHTIYFDFDRYNIRPQDMELLNSNAEWLRQNPDVMVRIEGHADERGDSEYNLALGEKRAMSVRNYLVDLGIDPQRLYTVSYGEERPADPGHNEEAWAKNRRAEFVVIEKGR